MRKQLMLLPLLASFYLYSFCQVTTNSNAVAFSNSRIAKIINGDWSGDIYLKSVKKPYRLQLSCSVEKNEFKITYPSFGCSGVWNIEKSSDTSVEFREHILTGKSACVDGGLVRLQIINNKQLACNFHLSNSKTIIAKGELILNSNSINNSKVSMPDTSKKSIVENKTNSFVNKNMTISDGRLPGVKSKSDSSILSAEGSKTILKNAVTDKNGSKNGDIHDPNNIDYAGDPEGTTPFVPMGANKKATKSANTNAKQPKTIGNTKILTLISPTYTLGDLPHLMFKDFTTQKETEYECDWTLPVIKEIEKKCEGHDGCPALKGQAYSVTLGLKVMDIEVYDIPSGEMKPTGKKEKRWVIVAATKINPPK